MDIKYFKKLNIPNKPGVYFFMKDKEILYIGKATSLKDRVKSYFGKDLIETRGPILVDLIFKATKIDWQETDSVLEALILEASLIKKYQPKYNTKEKSDKSFNYVCITKEKKIDVIRGKELQIKQDFLVRGSQPVLREGRRTKNIVLSGVSIFGPFTNGNQLREALRIVRKIFPFFYENKGIKGRDEFYKQIKLVPENLIENKNNIKNIKLLFEGKKKKILKDLEKEMNIYSKNREFEKAGEIKRQLFALQHINDVALIKSEVLKHNVLEGTLGRSDGDGQRKSLAKDFRGESENIMWKDHHFRIEAYDIAHMSGKNMVGVMVVVENGEVEKSEYKKFKIKTQVDANDTGALKDVLERRFNHPEWPFPSLIVVDGGIAQINAAKAVLAKMGLNIKVVSVLKDERHKPKDVLGDKEIVQKFKKEILLANSESHRFAITYHKKLRSKNFLK